MNIWIRKSCDFASQRNYLDELFKVYPTDSDVLRHIDGALWAEIESNFNKAKEDTSDENKIELLSSLFKLGVFPIKDSYVAYLREDPSALKRNPATVSRLAARVFQLGLDEVYKRSSAPKESNRQIGPMFKNWIAQGKGSRSVTQNLSDSSRFSECAAHGRGSAYLALDTPLAQP